MGLGGLAAVGGWIEVSKESRGQITMDADQNIALWVVSLTYTWMALISIVGFVGAIGRLKGAITFYAYTVTLNTIAIMAAGIYLIYTLFHKREDNDVDKCVNGSTGDAGDVKHWACQKGFDVLRILVIVVFVIIWIFQIVGIAIVFDYVGQLREEKELEADEERKAPTWMVSAPTPNASMRTTYDSAPYDPPLPVQSGWASAKSPYAFTSPGAQAGGSGR
ncbi:hypothetical protein NM688_g5989 [Phlebia brevispora]|uniref:Uncharacterized protein n=1 Tax=Phlebia brevispora TaxID=194682 RepID=A0ACC1SLM6_9APHY|nr:hypothetical protein NM688_g5989 [Phlebia brevispora]